MGSDRGRRYVYFTFAAEPIPWNGGQMCGNGVVEAGDGEVCDTAIESGDGSCGPLLDCDDAVACTRDFVNNGDPCAPTCHHVGLRSNTDSCCPLAAPQVDDALSAVFPDVHVDQISVSALTVDADCVALCGDSTLDGWEVCEIGDATSPCDDPAACVDDGDPCTVEGLSLIGGDDKLVGNVCIDCAQGNCECGFNVISQPDLGADGCCVARCVTTPGGPNCGTDTDCQE